MTSDHLDDRLNKVYRASDLQRLEEAYDAWADSYDEEVSRLGYLLRSVSTGYIGRFMGPEETILDAGAGTGLIGWYLSFMGFRNITAIDLSEKMLDFARAKDCYREARRMVLGEPLDFETDTFDSAYAVGVFTEGHAPPESFDEIVRVVRPGGRFLFSIRDDVHRDMGYREKHQELEAQSRLSLLATSPTFQPYVTVRPDIQHRVFVFQVN